MNGSDPKQIARELLEEAHPALVGLSHWIHANPELGYQEVLASGWVAEWLTTAGFEVHRAIGGIETALLGSYGPGPLHVAICAEYDALPGVGHACGHNVIAAAAVGAGLALAAVADELGLRVTVLGTPAEEGGGGKIGLIEAGAFDGVHAAMMVHPWPQDEAEPQLIAVRTLDVTYTGREAHAAGFPFLGVNAADALVVAQTALALLRQQLRATDRIHGIVTKGGDAPNVIPAHTTAQWMLRSPSLERLEELAVLVRDCFEAGALATGASVEITEQVTYADVRHDHELAALYQANAERLGRTFAQPEMPVSTDMGNVSYLVPTIHPMLGIDTGGAVNHHPDFAAACATPSADRAILDGALAMAWTAIDAASDAAVRARLLSGAREVPGGDARGSDPGPRADRPLAAEAEARPDVELAVTAGDTAGTPAAAEHVPPFDVAEAPAVEPRSVASRAADVADVDAMYVLAAAAVPAAARGALDPAAWEHDDERSPGDVTEADGAPAAPSTSTDAAAAGDWPGPGAAATSHERLEAEGFAPIAPDIAADPAEHGVDWPRNGSEQAGEDPRPR